MSRMKDLMTLIAVSTILSDDTEQPKPIKAASVSRITPAPPIPKGCKEYFFNERGGFSTERMLKVECVFKCVALNNKNAVRKFDNWLKLKQNKTTMKTYKVIIRPEHCKGANYFNSADCPLARAIREQLPAFALLGVGGERIADRENKYYHFDCTIWNYTAMQKLQAGKLKEVVVEF